jgi:hypothetical protein
MIRPVFMNSRVAQLDFGTIVFWLALKQCHLLVLEYRGPAHSQRQVNNVVTFWFLLGHRVAMSLSRLLSVRKQEL